MCITPFLFVKEQLLSFTCIYPQNRVKRAKINQTCQNHNTSSNQSDIAEHTTYQA